MRVSAVHYVIDHQIITLNYTQNLVSTMHIYRPSQIAVKDLFDRPTVTGK